MVVFAMECPLYTSSLCIKNAIARIQDPTMKSWFTTFVIRKGFADHKLLEYDLAWCYLGCLELKPRQWLHVHNAHDLSSQARLNILKALLSIWEGLEDHHRRVLSSIEFREYYVGVNEEISRLIEQESVVGNEWTSMDNDTFFNLYKNEYVSSDETSRDRQGSKAEQALKQTVEEELGITLVKVRPYWLINPYTRQKLELDMFCEEMNLAIEYNGPQHYEFSADHHWSKSHLHRQQMRDLVKQVLCEDMGIRLVKVKGSGNVNQDFKNVCDALSDWGVITPSPPSTNSTEMMQNFKHAWR
jgi:very-short-patch-repair endonuclease